jgi:putative redox protein
MLAIRNTGVTDSWMARARLSTGCVGARTDTKEIHDRDGSHYREAVMTIVTCRYDGDLRCSAEHGPSGVVLRTDAPVDNQGKGELFSPTDLIGTALATCLLTLMAITAERHASPLEGCTARVQKTMTDQGARRIARLDVWITLPAGLEEQQVKLLRRAAETCPVKRSLDGSVPMQLHWT